MTKFGRVKSERFQSMLIKNKFVGFMQDKFVFMKTNCKITRFVFMKVYMADGN